MSRKPRRGDVVEVEWADSERISLNGWAPTKRYLNAARRPASYRTSGYFVGRSGKKVVIVQSLSPATKTVADAMTIPRAVVTKTTVLGRSTKRIRKALRP